MLFDASAEKGTFRFLFLRLTNLSLSSRCHQLHRVPLPALHFNEYVFNLLKRIYLGGWWMSNVIHFCLIPEPHAGFRIAFNMFDADGNEMVDKREFLVVRASS